MTDITNKTAAVELALDSNAAAKAVLVAIVHKSEHEGVFEIDAYTGAVLTKPFDMPEWASGIQQTMPSERREWYSKRLGPAFDATAIPESYDIGDLAHLRITEDGTDLLEVGAEDEFRMEALATMTGLERDADAFGAGATKAFLKERTERVYEAEVAVDYTRTPGEHTAFEEVQATSFADAEQEQQTGT